MNKTNKEYENFLLFTYYKILLTIFFKLLYKNILWNIINSIKLIKFYYKFYVIKS